MANGNSQDDPQLQSQNLTLRTALNDAYAAVNGNKAVQSFSALTFEDLADQQIQRISGTDTQTRPNELHRVQNILTNLTQAVAQIKALPPESFADQDPNRDVNTPA
jgi:hypothetical protein